MILEAAALAPRNEIESGLFSRSSLPLETSSRQNLAPDRSPGFRAEDGREVAKPFLADWARNHPLVEDGAGRLPRVPRHDRPWRARQ